MKIAFLDIVHDSLRDGLLEDGHECVDLTNASKESIEQIIHDFEGIVVRSRFPIDSDFLSKASKLRFIARSGAGMENIDIAYCEDRSIDLFNAPEGNRNAVAEHALGMLLSLFNKLNSSDQEVRSGVWDREGNRGVELEGKVVGIIGYGNNGSSFAKKLMGFDCDVIAHDKYKKGFGNEFVKEVSMDELLNCSDVISLHIPQNEETKWMINDAFIRSANKPFYLINLSRGKLVVTSDLLSAIEHGKILGACLDVLEFEKSSFENMFEGEMPDAFKALLKSDRIILSPHVGGWTRESYRKLSEVLLSKIRSQH